MATFRSKLKLDFTDVILTPSTINIWAQLNVDDIYSFTNNEKEVRKKIKEIKDTELTDYVMYKYGLYISSLVSEFKHIPKKSVIDRYNNLVIHSRSDINITANEICEVLNKKPGSFIKDVYSKLELTIINKELENDNEKIKEFVKLNF